MTGIILINFGGPRNEKEIEPFLKEIFTGFLPAPIKFLAKTLARLRLPYAKKMYAAIGGYSPVVDRTNRQAEALKTKLPVDKKIKIYAGMQYGIPSVNEAVARARMDGAEKIILLPLYPYQSRHTDGTSLHVHKSTSLQVCTSAWYNHATYINAMIDIIKTRLPRDVSPPDIHLVFSAHAVPLSEIRAGSPYVRQIKESISKIVEHFTGCNRHLAFQSAYGPIRWTGPNMKTVLKRLHVCASTRQHVLIVPLGFACENVETLYEIDKIYIPYARQALRIQNISRTPALNDHPLFIDLLAKLVLDYL